MMSKRAMWMMVAIAAGGCGDEPGGAPGDGGAGSDETAALYVISSTLETPEGDTGTVFAVATLDETVTPDYARSIELPGGGTVIGAERAGVFFTVSPERSEVTRWTLAPGDAFVRGATVSFAGAQQLTSYANHHVFVDAHKAYSLDFRGGILFIWDPSEMVVRGEIDLSPLQREGWTANYGAQFVRDGDRLYVGVSWHQPEAQHVSFPATRLGVIDLATDAFVQVTDEDRCSNIYTSGRTPSGTTYFGSDAYSGLSFHVHGAASGMPPCQLRVRTTRDGFVDDYRVDLRTLVNGKPVGQPLLVSDTLAYLRVYDAEAIAGITAENFSERFNQPNARWWQWRLGEPSAVEVPDQPLAVPGGLHFVVEGRTFVTDSSADFSRTTLIELTPEGIERRLTVRGYPFGVLRVR